MEGKIHDIPTEKLMVEYFKMNFKNSVVHTGSVKWVLTDVFNNGIVMFCLVARVWMINSLFMPVLEGQEEWSPDKTVLLGMLSLSFILPQFFMHYLDYRRTQWKVGGASRKLMQSNLMRKFMAYSPQSLADTDHGLVILVLFKEI